MTTDENIRDKKLQYDISRAALKIAVLLSCNTSKNEYQTGEKILPLQHNRVTEEAKLTNSVFRKLLERRKGTIKKHAEKQVEALKFLESPGKELLSIKKLSQE